jgi:hypothetical protein
LLQLAAALLGPRTLPQDCSDSCACHFPSASRNSLPPLLLAPPCPRQALCKRYGLEIGAYCSWLVRLLMWVTFPVSWPLGKVRNRRGVGGKCV